MEPPVAIVLAAGKSTRMKSAVPKVLHELFGRPMIEYVLDSARGAGVRRIVVVVGHQAEQVEQALKHHSDIEFALQAEQRGTGHAVMVCRDNLKTHDGPVIILTGDAPLMRTESFTGLLKDFHDRRAECVIGTAETKANQGLGRIVRDAGGEFERIVEQKDATPQEAAITEINVGCYVFDCRLLFHALGQIRTDNRQGELYLTDCPAILKAEGKRVVVSKRLDIREAMGINSREQLADVQRAMQETAMDKLMSQGVTIVAPAQTYIDPRAKIGSDSVIYPFTTIDGPAVIGNNCRVGPHAYLGAGAKLPDGTQVEPFECIG